jgi:hypothetical protein
MPNSALALLLALALAPTRADSPNPWTVVGLKLRLMLVVEVCRYPHKPLPVWYTFRTIPGQLLGQVANIGKLHALCFKNPLNENADYVKCNAGFKRRGRMSHCLWHTVTWHVTRVEL